MLWWVAVNAATQERSGWGGGKKRGINPDYDGPE